MIELFDPQRLKSARRGPPLALLLPPLAVLLGLGSYNLWLGSRVSAVQVQTQALESRKPATPAPTAPSPALLADLQRQLQARQAEIALAQGQNEQAVPVSSWLNHLNTLTTPGISLQKVLVDRRGEVLIEGLASGAQPVSSFTQAWDRQERLAALPPRSIELRQDKVSPDQLRFQMRASLARPGT